jgi:hypothetical protein
MEMTLVAVRIEAGGCCDTRCAMCLRIRAALESGLHQLYVSVFTLHSRAVPANATVSVSAIGSEDLLEFHRTKVIARNGLCARVCDWRLFVCRILRGNYFYDTKRVVNDRLRRAFRTTVGRLSNVRSEQRSARRFVVACESMG